ncbi:MAG: hypothetical protein V4553_10590 [Bacteroidota bacterium]
MKKTLFLIVLICLVYTKGYCQLMQSNSIWSSSRGEKKVVPTSLEYVKKISNSSDSLLKNIPDKLFSIPANTVKVDQKQLISNIKALISKKSIDRKTKKDLEAKIKIAEDNYKREHAEKLASKKEINDLIIEKYTTYLEKLDKELDSCKNQIDKNFKQSETGFDTAINSKNGDYQRTIFSLNHQISSKSDKIKVKLDDLLSLRGAIQTCLKDLRKLNGDLSDYADMKETIYERSDAAIKKLQEASDKFISAKKLFITDYNLYIDAANTDIKNINSIVDKIKKDNAAEATDDERLSALGGINAILGDHGIVTPNVSVVGQKKFVSNEHSSIYGEAKLIIGANDEDKKNPGVNKLFMPEASTLGFMTDFSFGFNPSDTKPTYNDELQHYDQKLGINLGVYYLGKKLQPDSLTSFNTTVFHVKLGIEYIIIPHGLSAYFNTNQLLVATNIKNFDKYYPDAKRIRSFSSFGIQTYLNLNKKSEFYLLANLGFVSINDDVNTWLRSSDSIIPNIKFSLVKNFSF